MINDFFNLKLVRISVVCGLLCSVFLSFSHFNAACDDLKENVLRLHIIANSDSKEDQALKLKIRDEILSETTDVFSSNDTLEDAIRITNNNVEKFKKIADNIIKQNGFDYKSTVYVGNSFFENREYKDFTLPAGEYKSLIIKLGRAEGKNWWCVVFPAVCIPTAEKKELKDSTSEESALIAEHPDKYIMRFKTVELFEDFKKFLKK